jgi:large subunit ribosomal protein L3
MTQIFAADGSVVPVTKILAGPCLVVQKKTEEKDGYYAVKCAFGKKRQVTKSLLGIFRKFDKGNFRYLREFRLENDDPMAGKINEGDQLVAPIFTPGDIVLVSGVSKGRGHQGVVKRHGFRGGKKSHGHKDQLRMPGSIGCTGPQRVFKGKRMAGRMGNDNITVKNLEIIAVDNDYIYIKGAVPGARNGLIKLEAPGEFDLQVITPVQPVVEVVAPAVEEVVVTQSTDTVTTPTTETEASVASEVNAEPIVVATEAPVEVEATVTVEKEEQPEQESTNQQ